MGAAASAGANAGPNRAKRVFGGVESEGGNRWHPLQREFLSLAEIAEIIEIPLATPRF